MIEKAVIDRFEEGQAVLLVGDREEETDRPAQEPAQGRKRGPLAESRGGDGERLVSAAIDQEETAKARRRIVEKLERLRRGEHLS